MGILRDTLGVETIAHIRAKLGKPFRGTTLGVQPRNPLG